MSQPRLVKTPVSVSFLGLRDFAGDHYAFFELRNTSKHAVLYEAHAATGNPAYSVRYQKLGTQIQTPSTGGGRWSGYGGRHLEPADRIQFSVPLTNPDQTRISGEFQVGVDCPDPPSAFVQALPSFLQRQFSPEHRMPREHLRWSPKIVVAEE